MRVPMLGALVALVCLVAAPALAGPLVAGNGVYEVHVASGVDGDDSIGSWNAITDASHPVGAGHNLLYFGSTVATNFSSLRVYSALGGATDYTFDSHGGGISLDAWFLSEGPSPYSANGIRTVWGVTPELLQITQDVFVVGTSFGDSAIYHTVEIQNLDQNAALVGWRNLYDWQVDDPVFDDGPTNEVENTGSGVAVPETSFEFTYDPVAGDFVRVRTDAGGIPTYEPLLGIGYDPGFYPLALTVPDEYAYVSWPGSVSTSFDYTANPAVNVTGDSAGLSWFGRTFGSAYEILPGGTVRFTQVIFGVTPDAPPPGVPEPSTIALFGMSLAGLGVMIRRRLRAS